MTVSAKEHIYEMLVRLLERDERSLYQDGFAEELQAIRGEYRLDANGNCFAYGYELFDDWVQPELSRLAVELEQWGDEVAELRGQWCYDNSEIELPQDNPVLRVFGITSQIALRLEPILERARLIRRYLERSGFRMVRGGVHPDGRCGKYFRGEVPAEWLSISDLAKLIAKQKTGRSPDQSTVSKWQNDSEFPSKRSDGKVSVEAFIRWLEAHETLSKTYKIRDSRWKSA